MLTDKLEDFCPVTIYSVTDPTQFLVYNSIKFNFALNQTTSPILKNTLLFTSDNCNI